MLTELKQMAENRVGTSVDGKYRLEKVLGVGGMGSVYAARHRFTDRTVALKILHPRLAKGANAERFLREAKAAAAINHHGLADVLDAGKASDGTLYVAFELLSGQDFGSLVKSGKVSAAVTVEVALNVLEALDVVHKRGFVHRDIKPANIFVEGDVEGEYRAKLLDFGVVRRVTPKEGKRQRTVTRIGAMVGTPYYMSPEQMCGEAVDGRADLWALGVVMFYALTGKLPFRQRNMVALLTDMMKKGPPPVQKYNPGVPPELAAVVARTLSSKIEDRFQAAADMTMALEPCRKVEAPPKPDVWRIEVSSSSTSDIVVPPTTELPSAPTWASALDEIEGEIQTMSGQRRMPATKPEKEPPTRSGSLLGRFFKKKS